jgi:uncharacterized protein (TIGR02145 family)
MKKFFFVSFVLAFFISQMVAQVPQSINYQTVVRNSSGHLVKDQSVSLKFSLHLNSASGQEVYSEKHVKTTNQFGIVNLHIGKGSVLSGDFETIDWGAGKMFLKTFLDLNGGDNFTEMGTAEMVSVPYALYAGSIYVSYSNDTLYIGDQAIYLPSGGGGNTGNTVTDYDGNVYGTVTIGTQTWLAENLKSTHYADGNAITGVFDYDNNASNSASYGKLYTWDAAMNGAGTSSASPSGVQGVCPTGFHLPSQNEWKTLYDYVKDHYEVGGALIGQKLKETGTAHWETANGTNETGFSAVGSGEMFLNGGEPDFQQLKEGGDLWSATEFTSNPAQALEFRIYDSGSIMVQTNTVKNKDGGLAVRCIKD